MVTNEEKINKFHLAINHYAEEQRTKIEKEVAIFKQKELDQAEMEVLSEAYRLIQNEMAQMRDAISQEMAQREMDNRRTLLERRRAITEDIFSRATDSLRALTNSKEYASLLEKFAKNLSGVFQNNETTLYLRSADKSYEALVIRAFGKPCKVEIDDSIKIGGIRAYHPETNLEADETLDALLEDQRGWFAENSGLAIAQQLGEGGGQTL